MSSVDKFDRTIPVEAYVNGVRRTVRVVVHPDQVTILAGGPLQIEFEAGVWRMLSMHVATRAGALCRRLRHRG